ncbi:MAG: DUF5678 domain-containing protein [bacterium]
MDKDDKWIIEHFEEIVDNFGGLYIAVVNEEIVASNPSAKMAEEEALGKYPEKRPSVLIVPRKEDLVCVL